MALVSPGISISINDQSQYVNSNVGSVPLVLLATAQDKTYNGAPATGTSKANAGKLQSFTSQRELVTAMGTPKFQLSSIGTPVNGSEINEYGLLTAYSALGISNQLYAIRADIDLNQLVGTSVRATTPPADGEYWLDTVNSEFGLYEFDASTNSYIHITQANPAAGSANLLIIQNALDVYTDNGFSPAVPSPQPYIGQPGDYALVFVNQDGTNVETIRLFYKCTLDSVAGLNNTWVQVGSPSWQHAVPVVIGSITNPTIPTGSTFTINTYSVTTTASGVDGMVTAINTLNTYGIYAVKSATGALELFADRTTKSNPANPADGKLALKDGTNSPFALCGITAATSGPGTYYNAPGFQYSSYANEPAWYTTDSGSAAPSGSVWWKTSATGGGFNPVLKQYNASSGTYVTIPVPLYQTLSGAIYSLDPTGGGANIPHGTVIANTFIQRNSNSYNSLRFLVQNRDRSYFGNNPAEAMNYQREGHGLVTAPTVLTTATSGTPGTFTVGNSFTIRTTAPGQNTYLSYTVTLAGTSAAAFVSAVLAANIPYINCNLNNNGTIDIYHTTGGLFEMQDITGTPLETAGFVDGQGTGFTVVSGIVYVSNFSQIAENFVAQPTAPVGPAMDGTLWYYSNSADVDVMINDGHGWKGYRNVTKDVRGYNLTQTDPMGVIVSAGQPTSQSNGNSLQLGDLWLNSSDLVNWPNLSRYTAAGWTSINNQDHTSNGGIIFADARWDTSGTTDPISGDFPATSVLATSDYIDQDAPDYRLYPRGTLLFNTRRSGYNVKRFVTNYFTATNFPTVPAVPGATGSLPQIKGAWVSASGLDDNGVMLSGSKAQRAIVTAALKSAVDSNLDVLSNIYKFNLIVAPGYPELIPNMLTLNDNRGDTAFVIGDTPMTLQPNTVALTNWVNNVGGTGLPSDASASPYLALYYPAGQTNDLAGNTVVVPASHAVLRTFLYNDQISYPWFAPAGVNRGLISNLSNIGYINSSTGLFVQNAVSQGLRDALFTLGVNPLTQLPGTGLVVFGQLTRSGASTARNRVNVVRLENYLRTIFSSISNGYLFEPNDSVTRKSIASQIESALNKVLAHRGIYDYLVICDTSNNTSSTIANNQLYVDVAIEPMKDVEFIYIPIAIYNPGAIAKLNTTSS